MSLIIRDATPADADAICTIWNPIIRNSVITFNPQERSSAEQAAMINDRQAAGWAFLVAEEQGDILGFATYSQFRGGLGYARSMEHTINLSDWARGKGVGRALMAALEDHARARGVHVMVAGITGSNQSSIQFHAHLGYVHVGTLPQVGWKFGRWHDLVLMQKLL
ncbi:MAG: GNAT family N-acetyltransferase [Roseinatronobacter sp.]